MQERVVVSSPSLAPKDHPSVSGPLCSSTRREPGGPSISLSSAQLAANVREILRVQDSGSELSDVRACLGLDSMPLSLQISLNSSQFRDSF